MKEQVLEINSTKTTTTENSPVVHWGTKYKVRYDSIEGEREMLSSSHISVKLLTMSRSCGGDI